MSPEGNRTLAILRKAEEEGYGVLAQAWYVSRVGQCQSLSNALTRSYDANCVIGLVRAAERCRSPAIILMFPVTLQFGKGPWLQFCLNAYAHLMIILPVA